MALTAQEVFTETVRDLPQASGFASQRLSYRTWHTEVAVVERSDT